MAEKQVKKFGGVVHLIIFCCCRFAMDFQGGIFNGTVPLIQEYLDVSEVKIGTVASIAAFAILILSPMTAAAKPGPAITFCIGGGLLLWAISMVCYGLSRNYIHVLLSNFGMGIGGAPVIALVMPLLNDAAPEGAKSIYVTLYSLCTLGGNSVGLATQGIFSSFHDVQWMWIGLGAFVCPFALLILFAGQRFQREGVDNDDDNDCDYAAEDEEEDRSLMRNSTALRLARNVQGGAMYGLTLSSRYDKSGRPRFMSGGTTVGARESIESMPAAARATTDSVVKKKSGASMETPLQPAALAAGANSAAANTTPTPIWKNRALWCMILSSVVFEFVCRIVDVFLPQFAMVVGKIPGAVVGASMGSLKAIMVFIFAPIGGFLLDVIARYFSGGSSRKGLTGFLAVGLLCCASLIAAVFMWLAVIYVESQTIFFTSFSGVVAMVGIMNAPTMIAYMEVVEPRHRAMSLALYGCALQLGGFLSPTIMGIIVDSSNLIVGFCFNTAMWTLTVVFYSICTVMMARRAGLGCFSSNNTGNADLALSLQPRK